MTYDLPNPFMRLSVAGIPTSDRTAAALEPDEPAPTCGGVAAEPVRSQAKEPEASGGLCAIAASHAVRVGEAGADQPATSEHMDVTAGETAPISRGYPCCDDCGVREPCDRHCPYEQAMERYKARLNRARSGDSRFELDPAAFMSDIEPVPAFLTQPIMNETELMNVALDHLHYGADSRALEIEELLELARAKDWPAPPRRMAG